MRIGIVGFGFMGQMHYARWLRMPDVRVTAICDANPNIAGSLNETIGNIPGLPENIDTADLNIYTDFDKMLAEENLDAVSITLPTHLHAELTCKALQAGLNVLCEKPMALNIQQCQRMINTAEQTGKYLMIAHCIRFWPEYAHARQIINSGKYGKVRVANFQRISTKPTWSSDNWLADSQRSGGVILDLHIHDTDYIQHIFGIPSFVYSRATPAAEAAEHIITDYIYDNDMLVTAQGSWLASKTFNFKMSFEILLEQATIIYDSTRTPTCQIHPGHGESFCPELPAPDGYNAEIEYFCKHLRGETSEKIITMHQSLESLKIAETEKESATKNKIVKLLSLESSYE